MSALELALPRLPAVECEPLASAAKFALPPQKPIRQQQNFQKRLATIRQNHPNKPYRNERLLDRISKIGPSPTGGLGLLFGWRKV